MGHDREGSVDAFGGWGGDRPASGGGVTDPSRERKRRALTPLIPPRGGERLTPRWRLGFGLAGEVYG